MRNKNIAVIPARGGSKRIPDKNIKELCGKPMIWYTIDAAIKSGLFEKVVVSTDSPKIREIALSCGAEVPFLRASDISDDITPISVATLDTLNRFDIDCSKYTHICQLMANCPMRNSDDIINSYEFFFTHDLDSQISVAKYGWLNPWWAMQLLPDKSMEPLFSDEFDMRSQDLKTVYCPTGAIWWSTCESLRENGTFFIPKYAGCELSWQHSLDIDNYEDLEMAKVLLNTHLCSNEK